jgi:hypothetical protein
MSKEQVVHKDYTFKTPHFIFHLHAEFSKLEKAHNWYVGDEKGGCLDATIFMANADKVHNPHICRLNNIDALGECALQYEESESASFGKELLYAFIAALKANHPHVTLISLYDASYMPCNRRVKDTLDLLSYNMAVYGKTWYEMKAGAYLQNPEKHEKYEKQIAKYTSPDTKRNYSFDEVLSVIIGTNNYAYKYLKQSIDTYKTLYNDSTTFPIFFQKLKKHVPKEDTCKFFNLWLREWVSKFVQIERDWYIPIDKNETLGSVLNVSKKRPMATRKRAIYNKVRSRRRRSM